MNLTRTAHRLLLSGVAPLMLTLSSPLTRSRHRIEASQYGYDLNTYSSTSPPRPLTSTIPRTAATNGTCSISSRNWQICRHQAQRRGTMTLSGDTTGALGALASVAPYHGTDSYVGTAFVAALYRSGVPL